MGKTNIWETILKNPNIEDLCWIVSNAPEEYKAKALGAFVANFGTDRYC